jgi:hypothetical protein
VAALPRILHELKARGYRIVHVVPATPEQPATPTEPQQWQLHPVSETVATSHWPAIPNFVFTKPDTLPAPALADMAWQDERSTMPAQARNRAARGVSRAAPWPRQPSLPQNSAAIALPVPGPGVFEIEEKRRDGAPENAWSSHRAERKAASDDETVGRGNSVSADARDSRRTIPGGPPIMQSGLRPVGAH